MTMTIAVAGKGGTGKTTLAALLIKYLREGNCGSILAVDGDPSSNLNLALGLELHETIGRIREDALGEAGRGAFAGMSKVDYFEYRLEQALVEGEGVDLLAMGRPEGPGCYCAANNILRAAIDRLGNQYDYVVIDNEAGMEHISRQTTRFVDVLYIVSDPSVRGLMAAAHITELIAELGTRIGKVWFVVNRCPDSLPPAFLAQATELGLNLAGTLPTDPQVAEFDLVGRPLVELDNGSPLYRAVCEIAARTLPRQKPSPRENRGAPYLQIPEQ